MSTPLTLWIVYAAEKGDRVAVTDFTNGLFGGIVATLVFVAALWLSAKAGLSLVGMLAVSYSAWAAALGVSYALKALLA